MSNTYVTISGDTWDKIAYEAMGNEKYMALLMAANRKHIGTVIFPAGVELSIPNVPTETISTLPPWRR